MHRQRSIAILSGVAVLGLAGLKSGLLYSAQELQESSVQYTVPHPECTFYGKDHDKFAGVKRIAAAHALGAMTAQVAAVLPPAAVTSKAADPTDSSTTGTIDKYLFQAMSDAGVAPAPPTTDYEFLRRVSLDLTGRIPTPDAVTTFVNDQTPTKRSKLIDSLLASPQWIDKWTMYFGDFLQNNSSNAQIKRYPPGVVAFNAYIRASLTANKPYDQFARELIAAQGDSNYVQGEIGWMVGGVVTGGPTQDIWDQQTANMADAWLGLSHVNCLLCHNGRGHLDSLSLWGSQTSRQQAWGLSAFMSKTLVKSTAVGTANNPRYWTLYENAALKNYPLNTTTGNRPARQPIGTLANVSPAYLFTNQVPSSGQDYRVALGQFVTSDFQFARAAVNYIWAQFFSIGIVDPPDQFDPARLDPDNPPTDPWPTDPTQAWPLQPSNARLLNALAQDFIDSKYDLKALMREISNSRAYQLSARYNGTWDPASQNLFARKLVRRLWAEEVHDAIAQSSGIVPTYNNATYGSANWAMQLQEPLSTPDGANGPVNNFLNAFLRGNRDDQTRSGDGAILQALDLMNDNFVMSRVLMTKAPATSLIAKVKNLPNDQLVNTLFLTVLSRNPTSAEMSTAMSNLGAASTRNQEIENLLWSLYNKVDFIFNY